MKDSLLGQYLESNPVSYAHPKAPKPYQTRSAKALTEEQVFALLNVVGAKARAGDLVGKRDYALLLLYITTGMRRNEVMSLRGKEVIVEEKRIIIRGRVKGGDYQGREVIDRRVRAALLDYLRSSRPFRILRRQYTDMRTVERVDPAKESARLRLRPAPQRRGADPARVDPGGRR
jgi:integrase